MTWISYHRHGALGMTRIRLSRGRRRVLLALLTGAENLHGWRLCQAAQVGPGTLYPFLAHLEAAGWVEGTWGTGRTASGGRLRFYRLTGLGQQRSAGCLRLAVPGGENTEPQGADPGARH